MANKKFALVCISALPDVYAKVLKAKQLLASGDAKTASEAAALCGISRSAFYKYKDCVFSYNEQHVINLRAELRDIAGSLSEFLSILYKYDANVLTVNQGIPTDNVAAVTVSLRIDNEHHSVDDMIDNLRQLKGVVSIEQII